MYSWYEMCIIINGYTVIFLLLNHVVMTKNAAQDGNFVIILKTVNLGTNNYFVKII